jgi:hypothetical protein
MVLDILDDVAQERRRQEHLRAAGKFRFTCADTHDVLGNPVTYPEALAVLAEEFGEVSREIAEFVIAPAKMSRDDLYAELVQLAAVAVALAERVGVERAACPPTLPGSGALHWAHDC